MTSITSPEQVLNPQFLAYNARDLGEFLTHYAPDAQMYAHPSRLIATGHPELSRYFAARFHDSRLNSALLDRIVMDAYVIDHERHRPRADHPDLRSRPGNC
jgi:hypothetical protein